MITKYPTLPFTRNHWVKRVTQCRKYAPPSGSISLRPMRSHPTRRISLLLVISTSIQTDSNREYSRVVAPGLPHRPTSNSAVLLGCFREINLRCTVEGQY